MPVGRVARSPPENPLLTRSATSSAPPATAWALVARPARWREWAPHVRGAVGLGGPEVRAGASGFVRLLGVLPVPVRVTAKTRGRSWTWRVGGVEIRHRVEPLGDGCRVAVDMLAPAPIEAVLRRSYGPLVGLLVRNLARVAAEAEGP